MMSSCAIFPRTTRSAPVFRKLTFCCGIYEAVYCCGANRGQLCQPFGASAHQPPRDAQGRLQLPAGKTLADYPHADCQLGHLFVLIIRTINYLISMAALVAMYFIVTAGFGMVTALGNAEKIQSSKESISHAVIGFAIVILAFVFVNLLVNGIFGNTTAA